MFCEKCGTAAYWQSGKWLHDFRDPTTSGRYSDVGPHTIEVDPKYENRMFQMLSRPYYSCSDSGEDG